MSQRRRYKQVFDAHCQVLLNERTRPGTGVVVVNNSCRLFATGNPALVLIPPITMIIVSPDGWDFR
jgi:archaeosine-15-forming tRNA-guanine transglycosylase